MSDIKLFQKDNEVIKHNDFIRCRGSLSRNQRVIFLFFLQNTIDFLSYDRNMFEFSCELSKLKSVLNIEHTNYIFLRKSIEDLMFKRISWGVDKSGKGTYSTMLAGFELSDSVIKWSFSSFLLKKILNLENGYYTILKFKIITSFTSNYSIVLYELISQWKDRGYLELSIDEFRDFFGLEKDDYQRVQNLKNRVLLPSIIEINEKSDMELEYFDIKIGPKIIAFKFKWRVLSSKEIKDRDRKLSLESDYMDRFGYAIGKKYKLSNKWYTLTKDGLKYRSKIIMNFVESVNHISRLMENKILTDVDIKEKTDK